MSTATSVAAYEKICRQLRTESECRTPIVVRQEGPAGVDAKVKNTPEVEAELQKQCVDIIRRVAGRMDAFVEHVHCDADDQLAVIGNRIDATIINGDWLALTFGGRFSTAEFLRFVGRRLFTIMPDLEKRPNMELFRLWLVVSDRVPQPVVFRHVCLDVDVSPFFAVPTIEHPSAPLVQATASAAVAAAAAEQSSMASSNSTAQSQKEKAARSVPTTTGAGGTKSMVTDGVAPPASVVAAAPKLPQRMDEYEEEIPEDTSAADCDADSLVGTIAHARREPGLGTKVGPLFYRRLELAAGRRPLSSGCRAAEIRNLRVQSAQLQRVTQPTAIARPPLTARSTAPQQAAASSSTAITATPLAAQLEPKRALSSAPTTASQAAFESQASASLQSLYGTLIKAFTYSESAARRLLHFVTDVADKPPERLETLSNIPYHSMDGLILGETIRKEEGTVVRRGSWRHADVLVTQLNREQFLAAWQFQTRVQCFLRHPGMYSPYAVLQDPTHSSEMCYVVGEFPMHGTVFASLRRRASVERLSLAFLQTYALQLARCVIPALQLLHAEGYVHRDVSAQRVYDFGEGKFQLVVSSRFRSCDADGAAGGDGLATRWASPDALFTTRFRPADDVWSLGILLWEILSCCQDHPFPQYQLQDDVMAALAKGEVPQPPDELQWRRTPLWSKVVSPCFLPALRRPSLDALLKVVMEISV